MSPPIPELPSLRPEARLFLACAATGPVSAPAADLHSFVTPELDWGWFAETARVHALLPLAQRRLAEAGVMRPELEQQAKAVALRNLRLTAELLALARGFEAGEIRLLAWKGPALAMLAWGDITLREFRDLDLVVFPEDRARASALLERRGYRLEGGRTGARARALSRSDCEAIYRNSAGHRVELHWRFAAGLFATRLTVADVWPGRQAVTLGGGRVETLGRADMLLALGEHGAKHAWERLSWIADVGRLVGDREVDWAVVFRRARALGSERMLLLGLGLAEALLGAELPPAVQGRRRAHPGLPRLATWVTERLFRATPGHIPAGERRVFQLRVRERRRDRVRFILGQTFGIGEGDFQAVELPPVLYPLYYLLRPLRVARRFGAGFFAALVRR